MADEVTKQSVVHGVYSNFFDIVKNITPEPGVVFSKMIFPAMPDFELDKTNSYPIIILESPQVDLKIFHMGKNLTDGTINFNVYATSAKTRDLITDKIIYAIETNKGVLASKNIRQIELGNIMMDQVARGKIKVNFCTIPIKFKFWSDKTFAF